MPYCSKCGRELYGDELFCPGCGVVISGKSGPVCCPRCGSVMPTGATSCPNCGSVGSGTPEPPPAAVRRSVRGVIVTKEKSMLWAVLFALIIPGLGHLYVGNLKRGAMFFGGELLAAFVVLSATAITYSNSFIFAIFLLLVHFMNVFDAHTEVLLYNQALRR